MSMLLPEADTALAALVAATRAERRAREELREALAAQAGAVRALRAEGLTLDRIAHRLAYALHQPLSVAERQRLGDTLRKRLDRESHRTNRPPELRAQRSTPAPASLQSDGEAMEPHSSKEQTMSQIVKRVIVRTEEYLRPDDSDEVEDLGVPDEEEEIDEEEEDDRRAKRRRG